MSMIVREALSLTLYKLVKDGESKILVQVPFVNKEGEPLPDEDAEYTDIVKSTQELLEAGASPLYYVKDCESFLLPIVIQQIESSSGFSEETREKVIHLLMSQITEKELKGLLPEHSNLLFKQMLYHEKYLDELISRGLEFKQDIDNRYGNESVEVEAIKSGHITLFLKIAQNNMELDFDILYNKDRYNETSLAKVLEEIKEKVNNFKEPESEGYGNNYQEQRNELRKELIKMLDKWILKNKIENSIEKNDKRKGTKLKI